jgi:hypothetical protein
MKGRAVALAFLVLASAGATGCDKSITYSYFNVRVTLDRTTIDDELVDLIDACAAFADTPLRQDQASLPCPRHRIPNDLGVFQYTTSLTRGEIKFSAIMNGYWGDTLAQGELEPLGIAPGMTTERTLVIKAIPGVPRVPPGTITPVGDGGADAAPPGNDAGPGDARDGGIDAAADGADAARDGVDAPLDGVDAGADAAQDTGSDAGAG